MLLNINSVLPIPACAPQVKPSAPLHQSSVPQARAGVSKSDGGSKGCNKEVFRTRRLRNILKLYFVHLLPVSFIESKCVRFKEAEPPATISFRSKVSLKVQGQVVGLKANGSWSPKCLARFCFCESAPHGVVAAV